MRTSDSMEKDFILRLTDGSRSTEGQGSGRTDEIRGTVMKKRCHVKQNEVKGSDVQGHAEQEETKRIRDSKTQCFLLRKLNAITRVVAT